MEKILIPKKDYQRSLDLPVNKNIEVEVENTNGVSDGYHTFGELYEHRIRLFIALCSHIVERGVLKVWRSKKHSDGELAFGGTWFVLGINTNLGEQITYHLPISEWENTNFADTLGRAPMFDGHTAADVLERLKKL